MRSVDFESVQDSKRTSGVEPGAYVCRVIRSEDVADREYVKVIWDIAEGPHANHYSDQWGEEHPFAHQLIMSYKPTALSMLKGMLTAFAESNPGFDAMAAWNAGRLDMFNGRLIGLNLREEEYEYNGEVRTRLIVGDWIPANDVREGNVRPMSIKRIKGAPVHQQEADAHVIDLD